MMFVTVFLQVKDLKFNKVYKLLPLDCLPLPVKMAQAGNPAGAFPENVNH
jgi:hypothetical protein